MKVSPFNRFLLSLTVLLAASASLCAQNVWTGTASGVLNNSANYASGASVNADGNDTAIFVFGRNLTGNRALTASAEFKVNRINFEGAQSFTLTNSSQFSFSKGSSGVTQDSSANQTISGSFKMNDSGMTLTGNGSGIVTLSGGWTGGSLGLTKSGTSWFNINGDASSVGTMTISGGVLQVSRTTSGASLGTTTVNGGALLQTGIGTIGQIQLRGGVYMQSGVFSRTLGTAASNFNFGTGGGGFAAYGGTLTVSTALGTYAATNTGNGLASGRPLILGSSIADNVVTLTSNIGLAGAAREIRLVDNSNSANDSAVLSGIISGTAGGGLNLTGAGNLSLSNTNTYTGVTTIGSGVTLSVATINDGGVAGNLGQAASTASNLVLSGGTLRYTGASASTNRNFTLTAGTSSSIHVTEAANALTISGSSANTTGALNKTGAGTLILSGLNLHTGLTTVSNGTLRYGIANALSSGGVTVSGGTLDIATFNDTVGAVSVASGSITGTIGALTGTSYALQSGTVSAILDGAGALTKSSTGNVVLSGANNYSGATSITGGILNIRNATALGTTAGATSVSSGAALELQGDISVGAEALTLSGTGVSNAGALRNISGANTYGGLLTLGAASRVNSDAGTLTLSNAGTITGATFGLTVGGAGNTTINSIIGTTSGTLTKEGAGTLILTGANTFTGATSINTGILNIRHANALGTIAGNTSVSSGAALELQGDISVGAEALTLSGTGVSNAGALRNTSGSNTFGGLLTLGAPSRINSDAGSLTLSNAGTITGAGFGLTVGGAGNTTINSIIGTTSGTLTKEGAGTLILTGANTFTGATSITGGRLVIKEGGNLGGSISTVRSGAALVIDGTATSATIVVEGGGLLGGSGTVQSASTIFGTHSPGSSPGLQTFANGLTYEGGSQVEWELFSNVSEGNEVAPNGVRGGTIGWDGVNVTGGNLIFLNPTTLSLTFNRTGDSVSSVSWSNALWSSGNQRWLIYQVSGGGSISGFGNLSLATSDWRDSNDQALSSFGGDASSFFLEKIGNDIYLNLTLVPEPERLLLLLPGLLGIGWRRRREP